MLRIYRKQFLATAAHVLDEQKHGQLWAIISERYVDARALIAVLISTVVKATQDAVKAWSNA